MLDKLLSTKVVKKKNINRFMTFFICKLYM